MLHALLLVVAVWMIVALLVTGALVSWSVRRVVNYGTIQAGLISSLALLRLGYFRGASLVYLISTWMFATLAVSSMAGIWSPIIILYGTLPVSAAWLLGYQASLWTACACIGTMLVFAFLDMMGLGPPNTVPGTSIGMWFIAVQATLIGTIPVGQVIRTLRGALKELQGYKQHLEQLVDDRTAELVQARDLAEAANRAKGAFLAHMSHELRTPLNAILGFSNLLRATKVSDQQRRDLDIINRSGEHLLTLINDVLDVAKIEAGRMAIATAPCDLSMLVRNVADMMRARAEQKQLKLLVLEAPGFSWLVNADAPKLRQILINLLGNAIKFTAEGSITLRLDAQNGASADRVSVGFEVEDTGVGIPPEDQARVFNAFEQAANTGSQRGTGLGLAITKQFVALMGGAIELESARSKGSRFRVTIPFEIARDAPAKAAERIGKVVGLEPGQPEYRILIAEDHEESRAMLERTLRGAGFRVRTAEDGAAAVELFSDWQPHFVFMDLGMPVIGGIEAVERIRQLPGGAEARIAAVTASVFESECERVLASGMQDFVRKPYRPEEVFDCLARHLDLRFQFAQEPDAVPSGAPKKTPAESLAALPAALRQELADAVVSLNTEWVTAAIANVAEIDAPLAEVLSAMNQQLKYTAMLRMVSSAE
jgi:signal transduction histidine kinase/DNA-binding response OmpR family regulator